MKERPIILTIAGFDPSSGAGIAADLKTFEQHKCYGMAIQTANTIQTGDSFHDVNWIADETILGQLDVLLSRYDFAAVKIGLIPSFDLLIEALKRVRKKKQNQLVIWDPVLAASANFNFNHDQKRLDELLELVNWITPNWNEMKRLWGNEDPLVGASKMAEKIVVYLKGGHNENEKGKDYLFSENKQLIFHPKPGQYHEKHGSGCVFAAALSANLVKGYPRNKAILRAKRYIEHYLASNASLLGYHTR